MREYEMPKTLLDYCTHTPPETYIGAKQLDAAPLTELEFLNAKRLMAGEPVQPKDGGLERAGYLVRYPDGYISWSPKDVFEESYQKTNSLSFPLAFHALLTQPNMAIQRPVFNTYDVIILIRGEALSNGITKFYGSLENPNYVDNGLFIFNTTTGNMSQWMPTPKDLLANDWSLSPMRTATDRDPETGKIGYCNTHPATVVFKCPKDTESSYTDEDWENDKPF